MSAHSPPRMTDLHLTAGAVVVRTDAHAEPLRLEQVYREHFGFVWRSLRHLGVAEADVEDAAHDVFLVVHGKLASFEHRSRLSTWIYGICLRVAQARRRRAHVRHELPTAPDSDSLIEKSSPDPTASAALERREAEDMLDRILDTMPIEQRSAFTLFELDGCSCEEIAALCEIPLGTVYSRLRLAREAFRRATARIEAHDRFHTGEREQGAVR